MKRLESASEVIVILDSPTLPVRNIPSNSVYSPLIILDDDDHEHEDKTIQVCSFEYTQNRPESHENSPPSSTCILQSFSCSKTTPQRALVDHPEATTLVSPPSPQLPTTLISKQSKTKEKIKRNVVKLKNVQPKRQKKNRAKFAVLNKDLKCIGFKFPENQTIEAVDINSGNLPNKRSKILTSLPDILAENYLCSICSPSSLYGSSSDDNDDDDDEKMDLPRYAGRRRGRHRKGGSKYTLDDLEQEKIRSGVDSDETPLKNIVSKSVPIISGKCDYLQSSEHLEIDSLLEPLLLYTKPYLKLTTSDIRIISIQSLNPWYNHKTYERCDQKTTLSRYPNISDVFLDVLLRKFSPFNSEIDFSLTQNLCKLIASGSFRPSLDDFRRLVCFHLRPAQLPLETNPEDLNSVFLSQILLLFKEFCIYNFYNNNLMNSLSSISDMLKFAILISIDDRITDENFCLYDIFNILLVDCAQKDDECIALAHDVVEILDKSIDIREKVLNNLGPCKFRRFLAWKFYCDTLTNKKRPHRTLPKLTTLEMIPIFESTFRTLKNFCKIKFQLKCFWYVLQDTQPQVCLQEDQISQNLVDGVVARLWAGTVRALGKRMKDNWSDPEYSAILEAKDELLKLEFWFLKHSC